jgi:hypothetical protein
MNQAQGILTLVCHTGPFILFLLAAFVFVPLRQLKPCTIVKIMTMV